MSRCFPFPPPGYDKKPRPEDANVLKEEKPKEKKHKKEKKEREKREGKEKREKERSEGKHNEKKDKKDKHKDKKDKHKEKKKDKEKDRGKEKERSSISEVSEVVGLPEAKSGDKLFTKERKDENSYLDEKNRSANFHGENVENSVQSNLDWGTEEQKYVQELGRRIRDEEKVAATQPERSLGAEKGRDDEREIFAVRNPENSAENKGKSKSRQFDSRNIEGQGFSDDARFSGSMAQSLAGEAETKVAGMPAVLEKNDERMEGKEKSKEKDEKRVDKHKDKDRDKKGVGKDKDAEKKRKKEEKVKKKSDGKKSELDKSKDVNRINLTGVADKIVFNLSSEHLSNAATEENLKKRKDTAINGVCHDNEIRPNKLLRPASQPVMENGQKLEVTQTPVVFASDEPHAAANLKVENKEHRKNGLIESQSLPVPKQKPPAATFVPDQILEASKKPPHPDSKYLSQVLSVPKMDEWSDFVDQKWLFDSQDLLSRKPDAGSVGIEEPQVWSEALHLESTDIVALPYVLPY